MADKVYRRIITLTSDATTHDKTARLLMEALDTIVEELEKKLKDGAITVTATPGEIVAVREKSGKPRAPRGSVIAATLAALKEQVDALKPGELRAALGLQPGETPLADHLKELGDTRMADGNRVLTGKAAEDEARAMIGEAAGPTGRKGGKHTGTDLPAAHAPDAAP